MKKKFTFYVGVARLRTVTVEANTLEEADELAREKLDRVAESGGPEAPVSWSLTLKE